MSYKPTSQETQAYLKMTMRTAYPLKGTSPIYIWYLEILISHIPYPITCSIKVLIDDVIDATKYPGTQNS